MIRDLLNAWEGVSRNQAKNRFLSALPDAADRSHAAFVSPISNTHYHDNPNSFYKNGK